MREQENLKWSRDHVNKYVKQINDLWSKPNQSHWRKYFKKTKGYFYIVDKQVNEIVKGSGIGKRSISSNLFKSKKD